MNNIQTRVFMLLPFGMERPVSTGYIREVLGLDERSIREVIAELITEFNIPIGSLREIDRAGYFIATNEEEKIIGTHALRQQATKMEYRVTKVKDADIKTAYLYKEINAKKPNR